MRLELAVQVSLMVFGFIPIHHTFQGNVVVPEWPTTTPRTLLDVKKGAFEITLSLAAE